LTVYTFTDTKLGCIKIRKMQNYMLMSSSDTTQNMSNTVGEILKAPRAVKWWQLQATNIHTQSKLGIVLLGIEKRHTGCCYCASSRSMMTHA